jgi:predicted acylesterase/phospholipase RssA
VGGGAQEPTVAESGLEEKGIATPEPCCEEIRLALAMNGGVSLAVWMGGCAVELDRARRAGEDDEEKRGEGEESVYDVLADCFGRRLAIDILTGTSAGGINAALLGGAMTHGKELQPRFLRDKWIELGDLGKILHDPGKESPMALMNGELFHEKLAEAFEDLLDKQEPSERARARARVPYLDVTMTDVRGVERRFRDAWGGELVAREHRPRFKFRKRDHFTKDALADAARTSASFPFAFEPSRVRGRARILAGLPAQTWGVDGGLLDNAPIRDALEMIPTRRASTVVRRYFCYVNGDPLVSQETTIGEMPGLAKVGGYAITLPRVAPLVDHLYAIREAVERPRRTAEAQDQLLGMELTHLEQVAASLFDTYAQRRTLDSLEEILPEPSDAKATFDQLRETEGHLPWIPRRWQPGREPVWEWGLRPAQRILHLALDILRPAIAATAGDKDGIERRRALLKTRVKIEDQLKRLGDAHDLVTSADATNDPSRFEEEGAAARVNAACGEATTRRREAAEAIDEGLRELRTCMTTHGSLFERDSRPTPTREALFGSSADPQEEICCFVRRALSIEVVRRAFAAKSDFESSEELCFVQLTPEAPAPIFSANPIHLPGPATARQKLTGVGLGHFAGFYRRAWRANDYMWGRLDASARVVDLLLDKPSPEFGDGAGAPDAKARAEQRAERLSVYLWKRAQEDKDVWLIEEALLAAEAKSEEDGLEKALKKAIQAELEAAEETARRRSGPQLPLTRVLFQRAAQAEVLRDEIPVLLKESKNDRDLGSGADPLKLPAVHPEKGIEPQVKAIRGIYARRSSLPDDLTGEGEAVSDLGLQNLTHASFVSLAALRTAGVPMSKFLGLVRPPLLAVAGTVATRWWVRATAALGFWAAAMFLASRIVTERWHPDGSAAETAAASLDFSAVWTPATLLMLTALLGVAGFVLVPSVRARYGVSPGKNVAYAVGLTLCGGVLAALLAAFVQDLNLDRILFTPGAENPPEGLLWAVLFLLGVASVSRFPLPKRIQKLVRPKLAKLNRHGAWTCVLLSATFVGLSAFTGQSLVGVIDESIIHHEATRWRGIAALVALLGAPLAAGFAVSLAKGRREPKPDQPA